MSFKQNLLAFLFCVLVGVVVFICAEHPFTTPNTETQPPILSGTTSVETTDLDDTTNTITEPFSISNVTIPPGTKYSASAAQFGSGRYGYFDTMQSNVTINGYAYLDMYGKIIDSSVCDTGVAITIPEAPDGTEALFVHIVTNVPMGWVNVADIQF